MRFQTRGERFFIFILFLVCGFLIKDSFENVRILPKCSNYLYWNTTASLPKGLYVRIPCDDDFQNNLATGDYVVYYPDELSQILIRERKYMPDGMVLLKKVGAIAGEKFFIDEKTSQCYIGNTYIGQVAAHDHAGRPMPVIRGKHIIPEGYFFPLGRTAYSFDGRYSGPIPVKNIIARVIPVLTAY